MLADKVMQGPPCCLFCYSALPPLQPHSLLAVPPSWSHSYLRAFVLSVSYASVLFPLRPTWAGFASQPFSWLSSS